MTEGETARKPETPKQLVNVLFFSAEYGYGDVDLRERNKGRSQSYLEGRLNRPKSSRQYNVTAEDISTILYNVGPNLEDIQQYFQTFDVIVTHLTGIPERVKCFETPSLISNGTDFWKYPDLEDLLKLLRKLNINIPLVICSTVVAEHNLLINDPLLIGAVATPHDESRAIQLKEMIDKAFEERQRQKALKPQN